MRAALLLIVLASLGGCSEDTSAGTGTDAGPADIGSSCAKPCGSVCCAASQECINASCTVPCAPSCDGKKCGSDGCTGSCGSCPQGQICGSKFTCEVCTPKTCAQVGATCGDVADGCGGVLHCGATCTAPQTCGGGGVPNKCGCTPKVCLQGMCGLMADGCGGRVDCGKCGSGQYCSASSTCVTGTCPPETDQELCLRIGANCGQVTAFDNCGTSRVVASCGSCTSPQTCGVSSPNVCGDDCRVKPCSGLNWCDTSTGACRAGCSTSTQCGNNETCSASHTCDCKAGYHRCGTACVADTSPNSCGTSCTPCSAPANGTATCTTGTCGFTCKTGFHKCGSSCVSDTDVATCGTRCTACPTGTNGTPVCNAGKCELTCAAGYVYCNGACIACSDPNGTPTCNTSNGTCAFACKTGYHFDQGKCQVNVACDTYTKCAAGSHCYYPEKVCYSGTAPCTLDRDCGTNQYCKLTTGVCTTVTQTWTCTTSCADRSGACSSGGTCTNGACTPYGARDEGAWCRDGLECGSDYECSPYDWKCHYACNSSSCPMGTQSVYGSTCMGCGPYGGGSYYNSCWAITESTTCTNEGGFTKGLQCVNGKLTMRWPCKVKSDCAAAYTCGPTGKCQPYFETFCTTDSQCPNTTNFRCDVKNGICMPR